MRIQEMYDSEMREQAEDLIEEKKMYNKYMRGLEDSYDESDRMIDRIVEMGNEEDDNIYDYNNDYLTSPFYSENNNIDLLTEDIETDFYNKDNQDYDYYYNYYNNDDEMGDNYGDDINDW